MMAAMPRGRTKSQTKSKPTRPIPHEAGRFSGAHHLAVAVVAGLLIVIAYSNALHGKFVYDDNLEIVANPYIQRGELFWTAMTSDVWAFKGKRDEPWSNYWRPAFVAWMAMNYQLFELNVFGWHATSLLAHLAVTLLVFQVLLTLEARPWVAAAVTWGFAVHPVHVESVAWASGIPDILMSACLLTSFLFYHSARRGRGWGRWIAAGASYALALLCKEGAVMDGATDCRAARRHRPASAARLRSLPLLWPSSQYGTPSSGRCASSRLARRTWPAS
jgi:hypothetical protein